MTDLFDKAAALEEKQRAYAIAKATQSSSEEAISSDGFCIDCDEPIPPARLAINPNFCRCVACQSEFES